MNAFKKSLSVLFVGVLGFNLLGWSMTPHAIVAYLGYKYTTQKSKLKVLPLLKSSPDLPGQIKCYVKEGVPNADSFVACTVSSWSDSIKFCPVEQWGKGGEAALNFYANAHFMDTPFIYGTPKKISKAEAEKIVNEQINKIDAKSKDDLYYVYTSCIKSLAESQNPQTAQNITKNEQIFALRFLIHLSGDCTQPLHMSDPLYKLGGKDVNSFGGNTINFEDDINIENDGYSASIGELHELWDHPGKNFVSFMNPDATDTEIYIDKKSSAFIEKTANNIDKMFSSLRKKITNNEDCSNKDMILGWVIETYILAVENVCKGLGPIISYNENMSLVNKHGYRKCISVVPNTKLSVGSSVIETPTEDYIMGIQPIVGIQMYKGAVRLSNLLNAIYDPENAPKNYVKYITELLADKTVPTVNNLCKIYYSDES